jgi:hypothetical protein
VIQRDHACDAKRDDETISKRSARELCGATGVVSMSCYEDVTPVTGLEPDMTVVDH